MNILQINNCASNHNELKEVVNLIDSIKTKIQKLLTLAKDASDEESQTAMLHARKLMLNHIVH